MSTKALVAWLNVILTLNVNYKCKRLETVFVSCQRFQLRCSASCAEIEKLSRH